LQPLESHLELAAEWVRAGFELAVIEHELIVAFGFNWLRRTDL